jgi:cold shock CspA family protein
MYVGIVKYFNGREGFGFLDLPEGGELYFHRDDWHPVGTSENRVTFYLPSSRAGQKWAVRPAVRDKVVFERGVGRDGRERAKPWCFFYEYIQAFESLEQEDFIQKGE